MAWVLPCVVIILELQSWLAILAGNPGQFWRNMSFREHGICLYFGQVHVCTIVQVHACTITLVHACILAKVHVRTMAKVYACALAIVHMCDD